MKKLNLLLAIISIVVFSTTAYSEERIPSHCGDPVVCEELVLPFCVSEIRNIVRDYFEATIIDISVIGSTSENYIEVLVTLIEKDEVEVITVYVKNGEVLIQEGNK